MRMKAASLLVIIALLLTAIPSLVSAAPIGIDWYAGQNGNPWSGSPFTFETFSSANGFSKLDTFLGGGVGWGNSDSSVIVAPWYLKATHTQYAAVGYRPAAAGTAALTNSFAHKLKDFATGKTAEYMIVQSNGSDFYPIYPVKGSWEWLSVSAGQSIPAQPANTYLNSGDILYFVLRAKNSGETTEMECNPMVDFTAEGTDTAGLRPAAFGTFIHTHATSASTQTSSWYVNNQNTNTRQDGNPFVYTSGFAGVYDNILLERLNFSGAYAWTGANSAAPWVAPWFISATTGIDGVAEFTAMADGTASVHSTMPIATESKGGNDGLDIMLLQQNIDGGYYPMWPAAGQWAWQRVDDASNITMPTIQTGVKAGDRILFVVRSTGTSYYDTITVNPEITLTPGAIGTRPAFGAWDGEAAVPQTFNSSWYVNNQNTNSYTDSNPFAYLTGNNGQYTTLLPSRLNFGGTDHAWTNTGDAPPWVGPWFISAGWGADGVVEFTCDADGVVGFTSSQNLAFSNTSGECDGFEAVLVQKNAQGLYFPLWPAAGSWQFQTFNDSTNITMPVIKTGVQAGDKILFIVRSTGTPIHDTLNVAPQVIFTQNSTSVARPAAFGYFEGVPPVVVPAKIGLAGGSPLTISQGYLFGISPNSTLADVLTDLTGGEIKAFDAQGAEIVNTALPAATGITLKLFKDAVAVDSIELLIFGSLTASGGQSAEDIVVLRKYLLSLNALSDTQQLAADVNQSGSVNITDLIILKKGIAGTVTISQQPLFVGEQPEITDSSTLSMNQDDLYGMCYAAYESESTIGVTYKQGLKTVQNLGSTNIRLWMHSRNLLDNPTTFKSFAYRQMKKIVAEAHAKDLTVVGMNHNWFNGNADALAIPERDLTPGSAYVKFLLDYEQTWYTLVSGFPEITYWEIGNEWNHDPFIHKIGYTENDSLVFTAAEKAQITADMLFFAGQGVHRANPNALTVLGGLTGLQWEPSRNVAGFFGMLYDNIAQSGFSADPDRYFQIAAWHPYVMNHTAADQSWIDANLAAYAVVTGREGHSKPVFFTELGYSDAGNAGVDAQQAGYVTTMMAAIENNMPFVKMTHWFTLFDDHTAATWGGAHEANHGLMKEPANGFGPKAKAIAYQTKAGGTGDLYEFAH